MISVLVFGQNVDGLFLFSFLWYGYLYILRNTNVGIGMLFGNQYAFL